MTTGMRHMRCPECGPSQISDVTYPQEWMQMGRVASRRLLLQSQTTVTERADLLSKTAEQMRVVVA